MTNRQPADKKRGWTTGLANMLRKENSVWWGTKKWIIQSMAWTLIISGSITFLMYVFTTLPAGVKANMLESYGMGALALQFFFNITGMVCVIGVIILSHDLIISERTSGTAEWVFSKPISRKAFVIAKLVANAFAVTVIIVVMQGLLFAVVVHMFGAKIDLVPFTKGLALNWLICMFYLSFLIFLGTVFSSRGAVLGLALLFFLCGNLVPLLYPEAFYVMPWKLSDIAFAASMSIAWSAKFIIPVIMTGVWTILLIAGALWRIERIEI